MIDNNFVSWIYYVDRGVDLATYFYRVNVGFLNLNDVVVMYNESQSLPEFMSVIESDSSAFPRLQVEFLKVHQEFVFFITQCSKRFEQAVVLVFLLVKLV